MALTTILYVLAAILLIWIAFILGKKIGALQQDRNWQRQLPDIRKDAAKRSRAVIGGQFSEQLAPFLPNFPWKPTEAKFLGKPIDFLVFAGMDEKNIEEIIFVEVKSGKSSLSAPERSLKNAIENKRVSWDEYRIPDELTKTRESNK